MALKPGNRAPASGQYEEIGPRGGRTGHEVTTVRGEPLPPTTKPGSRLHDRGPDAERQRQGQVRHDWQGDNALSPLLGRTSPWSQRGRSPVYSTQIRLALAATLGSQLCLACETQTVPRFQCRPHRPGWYAVIDLGREIHGTDIRNARRWARGSADVRRRTASDLDAEVA